MTAQLENGYTRIANEIMDEVAKAKFNGSQFRIVFAVLRYTYGFHRKSAEMSISYLAEATGLPSRHIRKEVDRLISGKVLIEYKEPTKTTSREIGLNKNYSEWNICTSGANTPEEQIHPSPGEQLHPGGEVQLLHSGEEQLHPQERKLKDNYKENLKIGFCQSIFDTWNDQQIKVHRALSEGIEKAIMKALKSNTTGEIITAIIRYSTMLKDDQCEWCDYIWGLDTFLTRAKGYKYFLDEGEKWLTYQKQLAKRKPVVDSKPRASPAQEFYISPEERAALARGG